MLGRVDIVLAKYYDCHVEVIIWQCEELRW